MGNESGSDSVGTADNDTDTSESVATPQPDAADDVEADSDRAETTTCATCWQEIPPDRVRCPYCLGSGDRPETWFYDRIVLAVVPAGGAREARASAATAFARATTVVSGPDASHGEVTLRAAFETALPSALTDGWPDLPGAAPMTSAAGQSLFEAAAARCEAPETTDPMLYCEDGAAVAEGDDVETLERIVETADVQYWVVPGVVKQYTEMEEPDAFGTPLYCGNCGAVVEHDTADQAAASADRPERRLWVCRVCGAQRYGPH